MGRFFGCYDRIFLPSVAFSDVVPRYERNAIPSRWAHSYLNVLGEGCICVVSNGLVIIIGVDMVLFCWNILVTKKKIGIFRVLPLRKA